ncbi:GNAT family N-acetyltransferase [Sphingobacterium faecale]|uniref:GNAT family N-acetyltransferase n=1 Tax=Sphingobacterium faecale TaxID=2803775 RepID=A0ABS1R194_9SPHI|nr:GNAT family N-acetyltransferase [Sphingobacterium faecale]MBL1408443.1 GNAT family N-acetyltransferase [Sphingobacterium faecale]
MEQRIVIKAFEELTNVELYEILRLRSEVFVVEQTCIYQDIDGKDLSCHHVMLYMGDMLAAYSRVVPAGLSYTEISLGRVLVNPDFRGQGLGKLIVQETIEACYAILGKADIKIGAQYHLLAMYQSLGFKPEGQPYDEDGIEHIDMLKRYAK